MLSARKLRWARSDDDDQIFFCWRSRWGKSNPAPARASSLYHAGIFSSWCAHAKCTAAEMRARLRITHSQYFDANSAQDHLSEVPDRRVEESVGPPSGGLSVRAALLGRVARVRSSRCAPCSAVQGPRRVCLCSGARQPASCSARRNQRSGVPHDATRLGALPSRESSEQDRPSRAPPSPSIPRDGLSSQAVGVQAGRQGQCPARRPVGRRGQR